ncbi:hypothetical protein EMIHUDRAFT_122630 [Emiliania huxleyi CCMP1516]|uniref:Phospholipid/glycerol acyltransferase domain-containing protein n=2 Tax=Emiliania huxleyi TaxID=2903 RepID=A0A0D3KIX5_EMIH1|nr:hypothetical protein EMIHUDRAFT_122630 [Emiliania huxleyi CCMP1516]EOD35710.1 hypothetical protein EMIHUDRAFT_122630 [Emiliania huxleyi CCMP1516]|eukprot:XP_005788139.1 hypothetical protein EMIHUDRAFT_122630 [Emiliania huxleyi CCMP1516]
MSLLIACLPLGLATAPRAPPSPLAMATMAPPLARVAMLSASAVNLDAAAVDAAAAAAVLPPTPKTNAVSRKVFGITFALLTAFVVTGIYPLVISATIYSKLFDNERRRANDYVVQWWARTTLTLFGAKVALEGQENLPPPGEAVMYVPNHCSFLDIFSLSGFLPRRFKYISKIEILRIPLVGWAMGFAKHIALARTDRKSQLKTLKEAVETLKATPPPPLSASASSLFLSPLRIDSPPCTQWPKLLNSGRKELLGSHSYGTSNERACTSLHLSPKSKAAG